MKDTPIIFSGPMVKAILAGVKSQTRRVIKPQPKGTYVGEVGLREWAGVLAANAHPTPSKEEIAAKAESLRGHVYPFRGVHGLSSPSCPYGWPSKRLWVRETWTGTFHVDSFHVVYAADGSERFTQAPTGYILPKAALKPTNWVTPLFMPRWASRITLEITNVHVQLLQEISEEDARAEGYGVAFGPGMFSRAFDSYWDEINGKTYPWSTNPFVWALTFRRVQP